MKPRNLASVLVRQDHLERRLRTLEAALKLIATRGYTSDVVYERCGLPTAREIAQAALDGDLDGLGRPGSLT